MYLEPIGEFELAGGHTPSLHYVLISIEIPPVLRQEEDTQIEWMDTLTLFDKAVQLPRLLKCRLV
jgi:hypothetical protein